MEAQIYAVSMSHVYTLVNTYYAFPVKSTGLVPRGNFLRLWGRPGRRWAGNCSEERFFHAEVYRVASPAVAGRCGSDSGAQMLGVL